MDPSLIISESAGHGAIGLAFLEEGLTHRPGIFVRHRHDDTYRLAFDMYVPGQKYDPVSIWNCETHPRWQSVEFSVDPGLEWPHGVEWPQGIGALMSRRSWEILRQTADPLESSDWPTFDLFLRDYVAQSDTHNTISYQGKSCIEVTRIVLGNPTHPSADGHGKWRFELSLGLIDSDQEVCSVSRKWLGWKGNVIVKECATYFFPSLYVLLNH